MVVQKHITSRLTRSEGLRAFKLFCNIERFVAGFVTFKRREAGVKAPLHYAYIKINMVEKGD